MYRPIPTLLRLKRVRLSVCEKPLEVAFDEFASMSRVMPMSLLRYTPIPPGFCERVDRSPPSAPKAPPIDMNRAVPLKSCCEMAPAAAADCAKAIPEADAKVKKVNIFFINH